jgi:hypothetical protein
MSRALGYVDLSAGEKVFGLPAIPCWPEHNIKGNPLAQLVESRPLAAFHPAGCPCGDPYGIAYDLGAIEAAEYEPNEVLLHELTHAWQFWIDPEHYTERCVSELERFGYWDAPHEVEARAMARHLNALGVRVWFP